MAEASFHVLESLFNIGSLVGVRSWHKERGVESVGTEGGGTQKGLDRRESNTMKTASESHDWITGQQSLWICGWKLEQKRKRKSKE